MQCFKGIGSSSTCRFFPEEGKLSGSTGFDRRFMFPHFEVVAPDVPIVVVILITAVSHPVIEDRTTTALTLPTFSVHIDPFKEHGGGGVVRRVPTSNLFTVATICVLYRVIPILLLKTVHSLIPCMYG